MPYTSVNGNMFSYLQDGHLVLRLPAEERAAFLDRHDTRLHETHGLVQKEYVDVPDALFDDTGRLADAFPLTTRTPRRSGRSRRRGAHPRAADGGQPFAISSASRS